MTAGAQHRLVVRQRRRVATAAVAAVAAVSMLTFSLTRKSDDDVAPQQPAADLGNQQQTEDDSPDETDDVRALVRLADTDRSSRFSANWRAIQKPLKPYRKLVKGAQP
jgi:hypothetical protein